MPIGRQVRRADQPPVGRFVLGFAEGVPAFRAVVRFFAAVELPEDFAEPVAPDDFVAEDFDADAFDADVLDADDFAPEDFAVDAFGLDVFDVDDRDGELFDDVLRVVRRFDDPPIGSTSLTAFAAPPAMSPTVPATLPAWRVTVFTTLPGSGIENLLVAVRRIGRTHGGHALAVPDRRSVGATEHPGPIRDGRASPVHPPAAMQHDTPGTASESGTLQFIGNATVSIRWGGLHVLTDPNFIHGGERLELAPGVHATRLHDPAVKLDELGPVDAVVLSHFHADHFDRVAERDLRKDLPILAPPSAVEELRERGFTGGVGLETWDVEEVTSAAHRARVTALPGRHGPGVVDIVLPDVMGSMIELAGPSGDVRLYVSGDTLVFDDLEEIPHRFDGVDIGLFHLGGTRVAGIMVTMDGEQGVRAVQIIGATQNVPIHFDDYDRFTSPLSDFLTRAQEAGLADRVSVLPRGGTMELRPRSRAGVR